MERLWRVSLELTCAAQGYQYNIKIMKQLVTLDFKKDQGLILRWNCVNLSRPNKYFRHIIVLLASDTQLAKEALDGYIRNIKLGDLYTAVYNSKGVTRIREWREKTNRSQGNGESYLKGELGVSFGLEEACAIIQKQIQQIAEPTVVNFVLQQQTEISNLKLKIRQMQVEGKIKFITTIFSMAPQNHISISEGINQLCLEDRFVFEFFHHYLNQMALEQAHLSITCRNGEINSCSQSDWRNTAFNKIERKYYGPSIRYTKDILHFVNSKIIYGGEYNLDIELNFRCFGGINYTSYKHVAISFDNEALTNRTVCATRKRRIYYSTEDIALEENPYESQSLIHFELRSQKDQQCGQLQ